MATRPATSIPSREAARQCPKRRIRGVVRIADEDLHVRQDRILDEEQTGDKLRVARRPDGGAHIGVVGADAGALYFQDAQRILNRSEVSGESDRIIQTADARRRERRRAGDCHLRVGRHHRSSGGRYPDGVQVRFDRHRGDRGRALLAMDRASRVCRQPRTAPARRTRLGFTCGPPVTCRLNDQECRLDPARRIECAACHAGVWDAPAPPRIVLGIPPTGWTFRAMPGSPARDTLQRGYARRSHEETSGFGFSEALVYRWFVSVASRMPSNRPRFTWFDKRPPQGWPRRHVQSYKAMFMKETHFDTRHGERRHLPSLWSRGFGRIWLHWQQRLGRRARQERRDRRQGAPDSSISPRSIELLSI